MRATKFAVLLAALLILSPPGRIAALTIKVASLVPEGSPWYWALLKMASEWQAISDGRVRMKIYAGGIAGDETDTIRKMRIGQLQAAMVTGKGLGYIHPDFYVYQLPFVTRSDEELQNLFRQLQPDLEKRLQEKGFELLALTQSGWLRFFAKRQATSPEEMKKLRLFSLEGHAGIDQALRDGGFQIIPLRANDVFAALHSGMVEAFAAAPLVAASMQWFALASHMNDFHWSPLTGGLIITSGVWNAIPAELRPRLKSSAEAILEQLQLEAARLEEQAIDILIKNGLTVHPVPEQVVDRWRALVAEGLPLLVGEAISRGVYEQALAFVEDYRRGELKK